MRPRTCVCKLLILQACFLEILTSSAISEATNLNIVCQLNPSEALGQEDPQQPNILLKRCVSLSSDMNQGDLIQVSPLLGLSKPRPIYSPVHSPPPELASSNCDGANGRLSQPLILNQAQSFTSEQPSVYTQLQTQLFPQIKF
jgi:hypothetical protein